MAAIKVQNYENIVNFYTSAQGQLIGISDYYYDAAVEILLLDDFDPELALLDPFYNAYIASQSAYATPPTAVITAVGALQKHVLDKARTTASVVFTNINTWLDAYGTNTYIAAPGVGRYGDTSVNGTASIKVPTLFASLSASSGYTIESKNIS